jgi:D-alanine-D-alanine ligase
LRFPLFVKPSREGTGMGMDDRAIVWNEHELRRRVNWVINNYLQPALVEDYLPGREFTVGVLGRPDAASYSLHPEYYGKDGFHHFPIQEIDNSRSITPGVYGHRAKTLHTGDNGVPGFLCPADVTPELAQELNRLAILGHQTLGALDVSRVDFRMDAHGRPHLIEINSLPGLTPGFSDLCILAETEGMSYTNLILEILYLGASRFGLVKSHVKQIKPIRVLELSELAVSPYLPR